MRKMVMGIGSIGHDDHIIAVSSCCFIDSFDQFSLQGINYSRNKYTYLLHTFTAFGFL